MLLTLYSVFKTLSGKSVFIEIKRQKNWKFKFSFLSSLEVRVIKYFEICNRPIYYPYKRVKISNVINHYFEYYDQ